MLCVTLRPIPVAPGVLPAFLLLWNGICRILPDPCPALTHLDATLRKNARGGTGTVKLEARAFARGPKVAQYCPATLDGFAGDKSTSQVTIAPSPNRECPRDDPVQVPAKRQRQGQFDVRPCKPAVSLNPSSRGLSFFRVPTTGTPNQRNRVLFLSSRQRYS